MLTSQFHRHCTWDTSKSTSMLLFWLFDMIFAVYVVTWLFDVCALHYSWLVIERSCVGWTKLISMFYWRMFQNYVVDHLEHLICLHGFCNLWYFYFIFECLSILLLLFPVVRSLGVKAYYDDRTHITHTLFILYSVSYCFLVQKLIWNIFAGFKKLKKLFLTTFQILHHV